MARHIKQQSRVQREEIRTPLPTQRYTVLKRRLYRFNTKGGSCDECAANVAVTAIYWMNYG